MTAYKYHYVKLPNWQRPPSWGPLAGAVSDTGTRPLWGRILRYFPIFWILGTAACVPATYDSDAGPEPRLLVELRVDNRNWGDAGVSIIPVAGGRIGRGITVTSLSQQTIRKPTLAPQFRVYVNIFASTAEWVSGVWDTIQYPCLEVTILNQITLSYAVPC